MSRLKCSLALSVAIAAVVPAAALAQPPLRPSGCDVVITTPSGTTGTPLAIEKKFEAYAFVCGP